MQLLVSKYESSRSKSVAKAKVGGSSGGSVWSSGLDRVGQKLQGSLVCTTRGADGARRRPGNGFNKRRAGGQMLTAKRGSHDQNKHARKV